MNTTTWWSTTSQDWRDQGWSDARPPAPLPAREAWDAQPSRTGKAAGHRTASPPTSSRARVDWSPSPGQLPSPLEFLCKSSPCRPSPREQRRNLPPHLLPTKRVAPLASLETARLSQVPAAGSKTELNNVRLHSKATQTSCSR